jgi:S1-C subfamily serine protease
MRAVAKVLLVLGSAAAVGIGYGYGVGSVGRGESNVATAGVTQAPPVQPGSYTAEEQVTIDVARRVAPAVVSIGTTTARGEGLGSGVIIRSNGMILTNAHVVGSARTVDVSLADGRTLDGTVLGRDPALDIAVVRVAATNLPAVSIGNSDQLQVGQRAIAIGNPVGFTRSVTTGVVSALNRNAGRGTYEPFIQTDAAISPGNSGGPLLDSRGAVIGINSVVVRAPGSEGLGFAIPINAAMDMANQVLATGSYRRAYVGVNLDDLDAEVARQYRLPISAGAIITAVAPDSPGAAAGIRAGDVVTRIDDTPIASSSDLLRVLRRHKPGETVRLTLARYPDFRSATISVRLGEMTG